MFSGRTFKNGYFAYSRRRRDFFWVFALLSINPPLFRNHEQQGGGLFDMNPSDGTPLLPADDAVWNGEIRHSHRGPEPIQRQFAFRTSVMNWHSVSSTIQRIDRPR